MHRASRGTWRPTTTATRLRSRSTRATLRSDNTVYAQLTLDVGPEKVREDGARSSASRSTARRRRRLRAVDRARRDRRLAARHGVGVRDARRRRRSTRSRWRSAKVVLAERQEDTSAGWGKPKRKRVISDGVAATVTQILEQNIQYGTGVGANFGRPAAGKTGTTEEHADAWFCGYTPRLATTVWVGYPNGRDADDERARDRRRRRHVPGADLAALHELGDRTATPRRLPGAEARSRSGSDFERGPVRSLVRLRTATPTYTPPATTTDDDDDDARRRRPDAPPAPPPTTKPHRRPTPPPPPPSRRRRAASAAVDDRPPPPRRASADRRPRRPLACAGARRGALRRAARRGLRRRRVADGAPLVPADGGRADGDRVWAWVFLALPRRGVRRLPRRAAAPAPQAAGARVGGRARRRDPARAARRRRCCSRPTPGRTGTTAGIAAVHGANPYVATRRATFPRRPRVPYMPAPTGATRRSVYGPGVHARLGAGRARGRRSPRRRPGSSRRWRRVARARRARCSPRGCRRGRPSRPPSWAGTRCSRCTSRAAATTTRGWRRSSLGALALGRSAAQAAGRRGVGRSRCWSSGCRSSSSRCARSRRARRAAIRRPRRLRRRGRAASPRSRRGATAATGCDAFGPLARNAAARRRSRSRTGSSSSASRTALAVVLAVAAFARRLRWLAARGWRGRARLGLAAGLAAARDAPTSRPGTSSGRCRSPPPRTTAPRSCSRWASARTCSQTIPL